MSQRFHLLRSALVALAGTAMAGSAAAQQMLMTIDSTADVGILMDPMDGSVQTSAFLDIGAAAVAAGYTGSTTPIEALQVGNEIWVSDQLADRIWRFDLQTGDFIDDIGVDLAGDGVLNNIRGIEVVGDTVYASLGNDSTSVLEGIATIDVPSLTVTGSFNGRDPLDTSYFDVLYHNGELLVANIDTGNDGIERYDLAGNFLGILFASDGATSIDFPEQISPDGVDILVAGFSPPSGVYSISSEGDDNGIVAGLDAGPRGCWRLGNGEIAWTNGTFIATDTTTILTPGSFRFFSIIDFSGGDDCPGDIADDFGTLGGDDMISFGDFLALLGLVGPCPGGDPGCIGDIADDFGSLGGDGMVSFGDFLALLGLVGPCP